MFVLSTIGCAPARFFPYDDKVFNKEPDLFTTSIASSNRISGYINLNKDVKKGNKKALLKKMKLSIYHKYPIVCGINLYATAIFAIFNGGFIAFPTDKQIKKAKDLKIESRTIIIIGYDDGIKIKNPENNIETNGAFIFQNSRGARWGENGFGYIPYKYAEHITEKMMNGVWAMKKGKRGFFKQFDIE